MECKAMFYPPWVGRHLCLAPTLGPVSVSDNQTAYLPRQLMFQVVGLSDRRER